MKKILTFSVPAVLIGIAAFACQVKVVESDVKAQEEKQTDFCVVGGYDRFYSATCDAVKKISATFDEAPAVNLVTAVKQAQKAGWKVKNCTPSGKGMTCFMVK